MAENGNHIEVDTKFGKVSAWGKNLLLGLTFTVLGALVLWTNWQREQEHDEMYCLVSVHLWLSHNLEEFSIAARQNLLTTIYRKCFADISVMNKDKKH